MKQREKTPTPGHKGGQAKATAHSAKQPPPGKHGSISLSKGSLSKASSGDREIYLPPPPKPGARNKKNKKKTYELYVKIDIVSKLKTTHLVTSSSSIYFDFQNIKASSIGCRRKLLSLALLCGWRNAFHMRRGSIANDISVGSTS